MREVVFNLVLAVIGLLCTIVTVKIVPYIKARFTNEQLVTITDWTKKAVACAEILFNVPKSGAAKKAYVLNFLNKLLNSEKEVISEAELNVLIEAAVKELKASSVTTGGENE